jgi:hypothetical protein
LESFEKRQEGEHASLLDSLEEHEEQIIQERNNAWVERIKTSDIIVTFLNIILALSLPHHNENSIAKLKLLSWNKS